MARFPHPIWAIRGYGGPGAPRVLSHLQAAVLLAARLIGGAGQRGARGRLMIEPLGSSCFRTIARPGDSSDTTMYCPGLPR